MLPTIIVLVVVLGIGGGVWAYLNRIPKGIDAGISSFQRELDALAPRTVRTRPGQADNGLAVVGSGPLSADEPGESDDESGEPGEPDEPGASGEVEAPPVSAEVAGAGGATVEDPPTATEDADVDLDVDADPGPAPADDEKSDGGN